MTVVTNRGEEAPPLSSQHRGIGEEFGCIDINTGYPDYSVKVLRGCNESDSQGREQHRAYQRKDDWQTGVDN